jgi:hypothetical protein
VKRRQFIALLGGGAAAWPLAARAQQPSKLPTIGFLGQHARSAVTEWTAAFVQRLRELGWIEGRGEAGRHASRAADQVRSRHQPDHRQGARADDPGIISAARRRGDRIIAGFAAIAYGRFWHLCDIARSRIDVRFRGLTRTLSRHRRTAEPDPKRTWAAYPHQLSPSVFHMPFAVATTRSPTLSSALMNTSARVFRTTLQ